jgi:hypothetical protein
MDIALWIKMHGPNNSTTFIYKPTTRAGQIVHAHFKHFFLIARLEVVSSMSPILQNLFKQFLNVFHAMN